MLKWNVNNKNIKTFLKKHLNSAFSRFLSPNISTDSEIKGDLYSRS